MLPFKFIIFFTKAEVVEPLSAATGSMSQRNSRWPWMTCDITVAFTCYRSSHASFVATPQCEECATRRTDTANGCKWNIFKKAVSRAKLSMPVLRLTLICNFHHGAYLSGDKLHLKLESVKAWLTLQGKDFFATISESTFGFAPYGLLLHNPKWSAKDNLGKDAKPHIF